MTAIYTIVVGAFVGSFLNVCIYRLPREISLWRPLRSFCPSCRSSLKWMEMVPIVSWLALKMRCSQCRCFISFRYPLVELLTGMLFLVLWIFLGYPMALGFWVLASFLVVAAFIDLEWLIIPDSLTRWGLFLGFLLSLMAPASLGAQSSNVGISRAVMGSLVGYLLLWGILEVGKRSFGQAYFRWDSPRQFCFFRKAGKITFKCGKDTWNGDELFIRKSNELIIETDFWRTSEHMEGEGEVRFRYDCFVSPQGEMPLSDVREIFGRATALVIPREAMGWGDAKFLAAIGAFVGLPGVLFILFFASLVGSLVGVGVLLRRHGRTLIPFGPFLATGTLTWILGGHALWNAYFYRLGLQELLPKGLKFLVEADKL